MKEYTNTSNFTYPDNPKEGSALLFQLLEIFKITLACSGIVLNSLNILFLKQTKCLIRPHMRIILCLTITDLLLSVEVILYGVIKHLPLGVECIDCIRFLLKFYETTSLMFSMFILLLIAGDQCVSVVKPIEYHQIITIKRTNIALVMAWVFCFLVALAGGVLFTLDRHYIYGETIYRCFIVRRQYTFLVNAIVGILEFPMFLGLYYVIFKSVKRLRGRDSLRGRKLPLTKTIQTTLLLILAPCILYFPVAIYILVVSTFRLTINWPFGKVFMFVIVFHANSEPIICAVRFQNLKDRYKSMFCKRPYQPRNIVSHLRMSSKQSREV